MRRLAIVSSIFVVAVLCVAAVLLINKVDAQQDRVTPVPVAKSIMTPSASLEKASAVAVDTVVIENWALSCRENSPEAGKKQCSAINRITDQKTGQVLFVWLVGKNKEQQLVSSFQTPTGVLIAPGLDLILNDQRARKISFVACDERRCDASLLMDQKFTDELKLAQEASAQIVSVTGHNILFKINPKGIQDIVAALTQ